MGRLSPRKDLVHICVGGWVGPSAGLDWCGISRPCLDSISGPSKPVAGRYTDWAQTLGSAILIEFKLANSWTTSLSPHPPDAQTENWATDNRRLQQWFLQTKKQVVSTIVLMLDVITSTAALLALPSNGVTWLTPRMRAHQICLTW
jgi:hypothetical protein